jgi:outer membrane protein assembly factor BamB
MNCSNTAVGQNEGFSFNSFIVIDGKLYASSSDGIFLVEGDTDNGTDIDAFFSTFSTDFGVNTKKRIRSIYLSGNSKGNLYVTPVMDNDEGKNYLVNPENTLYFRSHKVAIDRDERGFYIGVKVANVDGVDFAINSIDILSFAIPQR